MTCSPERTHFCKIIPEDTLRFNKLRFPRKFVRKYGSELSSHVQLTVPDGDTFTVEVGKSDNGEVWLEKGWQQFSEHYSLKPGFFLVFDYEGNGSFHVLPFDISASEIDYPYISDSDDGGDEENLQPNKEEEAAKLKENDSADILNRTPQFLQPKKEAEEVKDNSFAGRLNQTPPEGKTSKKSGPRRIQRKTPSDKSNCKTGSDKSLQPIKEEAAQPKENDLADLLNRSTPQFLQPKKEAEEAKDNSSSGILNQTPAEGTRPCKRLRKTTSDKSDCKATSHKNEIDSKDVSSDEGYPHSKVVRGRLKFGGKQNSKPLQRAAAFKSDKPYFVVEMQPSYIDPGRKMVIPSKFTSRHLLEKACDVTLCTVDGKTWPARYLRYVANKKYTKAVLYDGWREFMRDNKLRLGDVCVFELTDQTEILFQVLIYRVGEDSNSDSLSGGINTLANCGSGSLSRKRSRESKQLCSERPLTSHEKEIALISAKHFRSKNPYFKIVMQPAYLGERIYMNIPFKFAEKYLAKEEEHVVLQVSEGRTWLVKFKYYRVGSGQHKAKFCENWRAFTQDNNLKVGDVCVFELIDENETSFKVSIFKAASDVKLHISATS